MKKRSTLMNIIAWDISKFSRETVWSILVWRTFQTFLLLQGHHHQIPLHEEMWLRKLCFVPSPQLNRKNDHKKWFQWSCVYALGSTSSSLESVSSLISISVATNSYFHTNTNMNNFRQYSFWWIWILFGFWKNIWIYLNS